MGPRDFRPRFGLVLHRLQESKADRKSEWFLVQEFPWARTALSGQQIDLINSFLFGNFLPTFN